MMHAGAHLFGEVFKGELVKKVEADAALSKVVNIANGSSSVKVFQRPTWSKFGESGQFFFY